MADKTAMSDSEIAEQLSALTSWSLDDGMLYREFVFEDFVRAMGFMASAAIVAEKMDHHPDWSNVYKKVRVHLTTHEVGGLTALDFTLARRMDALAG